MELANRALSHNSKHVSGRAQSDTLDRAYCLLGCFRPMTTKLRPLVVEVRSLKGWSGNKRLHFEQTDDIIRKAQITTQVIISTFADATFKHYHLPIPEDRKVVSPSLDRSFVELIDSKNVRKRKRELPKQELVTVPYLLSHDWSAYIDQKLNKSLLRNWTFGSKIDKKSLDGYEIMEQYLYK